MRSTTRSRRRPTPRTPTTAPPVLLLPPNRLQVRVGAIKKAVYESKPQMQGAGLCAAAKADAGAQVTKWRGKWRASAGGFDAPKQDFDFGWCATDTRLLRAGSLIRANSG
jgi:hypothetical protein